MTRSWILLSRIGALILAWLVSPASQAQSPLPTPTAAGRSVVKPAPRPETREKDEDESDDDDSDPMSRLGEDLPEPFLCEFTQRTSQTGKGRRWENTGSEYPRIAPPVTKLETLSRAFTRSTSGGQGPSWGLCSEISPGLKNGELTITLFAHVSKGKTSPVDDERCRWTGAAPRREGAREIRLRQGSFEGIEFQNESGDRLRFSAHWPRKTDPDTSGEHCRELAAEMSKPEFLPTNFVEVVLKDVPGKKKSK